MARIRLCSFCNTKNLPDEMFCIGNSCGMPLAGTNLQEDEGSDSGMRDEGEPGSGENFRGEAPASDTREVPFQSQPAAAETRMASLEGPWGCHEFQHEFFVGRGAAYSPNANLFASHMTVSARHARLFCSAGQWFVEDVGSTNGTTVNGIKAEAGRPVMLMDGDRLCFSRGMPAVFRTKRTAP